MKLLAPQVSGIGCQMLMVLSGNQAGGYYPGETADEAGSMHANSNRTVSDIATCDGDFEVFLVAVKPATERVRGGTQGEIYAKSCMAC